MVGNWSLQIISKLILDPDVRVCLVPLGCLSIWPHNFVGYNKDVVSIEGCGKCNIPYWVREKTLGAIYIYIYI